MFRKLTLLTCAALLCLGSLSGCATFMNGDKVDWAQVEGAIRVAHEAYDLLVATGVIKQDVEDNATRERLYSIAFDLIGRYGGTVAEEVVEVFNGLRGN